MARDSLPAGKRLGPDGRFLLIREDQEGRREQAIRLVTNWLEELRRRVPVP